MKKIFFLILIVFCFLVANQVLAQNLPPSQPNPNQATLYGLDTTAQQAGLKTSQQPLTIAQVIGLIINAFLGLIGVVYLIIIIYSGFQWMTAGGNEETVTKAKKRLTNATIGIVLVFTAFIITNFVIFNILGITVGFTTIEELPTG